MILEWMMWCVSNLLNNVSMSRYEQRCHAFGRLNGQRQELNFDYLSSTHGCCAAKPPNPRERRADEASLPRVPRLRHPFFLLGKLIVLTFDNGAKWPLCGMGDCAKPFQCGCGKACM